MRYFKVYFAIIVFLTVSCNKKEQRPDTFIDTTKESWLIDVDDIIHLGSEKDKIKSLDTLEFINIESSLLDDDEVVFAYSHNGIVHVYQLSVLQVHEIINDSIDEHYFAVTHCPLTSSSLAWNRLIHEEVSSFGVSGQLYKENLIPYDRNTESNWSQMLSLCVNGSLIGEQIETKQLIKTKFSTIKNSFPNAMILDHSHCDELGCIRGLKVSGEEPGSSNNTDIIDSEKYYGIVGSNSVSLLPFSEFDDELTVFHLMVESNRVVLLMSNNNSIKTVFYSDGKSFTAIRDSLPIVMMDNIGNYYDLFGYVRNGDEIGNRLDSPTSYHAHTFAWKNIFGSTNVISLKR